MGRYRPWGIEQNVENAFLKSVNFQFNIVCILSPSFALLFIIPIY